MGNDKDYEEVGDEDYIDEVLEGKERRPIIEKKHLEPYWCRCLPFDVYPWLVLSAVCFLTFGSYWVFDTPGAIFAQIQCWFANGSDECNYTQGENLLLYSVYSYPNVFLAFFGGYIIDRLTGVRFGCMLFCGLVLLGEFVFALGITTRAYWLAILGRFIFGLGGESLTVGQNTYIARWFEGKLLALAFGITISFSRIGSSINFIVTPLLAGDCPVDSEGFIECSSKVALETPGPLTVPVAIWFGTFTCILSFAACIVAAFFDWYGRGRVKTTASEEPPSLLHVKYFPASAWLLFVICVTFYVPVLTFYTVASNIFQQSGFVEYSPDVSSLFIAIPNMLSIFLSPLFGFIIDRVGRALLFIQFACGLVLLAHIGFLANAGMIVPINPIPLMCILGCGYSMGAAALWPILSHIIPAKMLGTAYGTMTSMQNLGLAIFPNIIGAAQTALVHSSNENLVPLAYTVPLVIFMASAIAAAILNLVLIRVDKKYTEGRLNATPAERAALARTENVTINTEDSAEVAPGITKKTMIGVRRTYLARLGIYKPIAAI